MNKTDLPKEYKGLKIEYKGNNGTIHAIFNRGNETILVYDNFFTQREEVQWGILQHEFCHYLFNNFSQKDKDFWKIIDKQEDLYISPYAKEMSKFLKGSEESFGECGKILKICEIQKSKIELGDYRDVKLFIANFLIKKYDKQ